MALTDEQRQFLEQLATRIPKLFEAIRQGNIKSEYIIGVRRVGARHVRLKLVAEVVDPGANPLATHSTLRPVRVSVQSDFVTPVKKVTRSPSLASRRRSPRKR